MLKTIPLKDIKFVLLDMDGTLFDLYFDDYFWGHLVPEKYAEKHNMTFGAARDFLYHTYKSHEKTLNWCDIDLWSKEFIEFWQRAEKFLKFDKEKTLFIDDTEDVLKTAKEYGIKYLLFKARANSKLEPKKSNNFLVIHDFRELMHEGI